MPTTGATTLIETACERLRQDIISGTLAPESKLRIEELRKKYSTGASPLREALNRLAGEGFVTAEGQRGFRVAPTSLKDLNEIARLRVMLECEALRLSIQDGDDTWEARIVAAFHRVAKLDADPNSDVTEWELRNRDFHESLVSACDSAWLLKYRNTLYEQHRRYRIVSFLQHHKSRVVSDEHKCIMEATLARDEKTACGALEAHIMRAAVEYSQLRA